MRLSHINRTEIVMIASPATPLTTKCLGAYSTAEFCSMASAVIIQAIETILVMMVTRYSLLVPIPIVMLAVAIIIDVIVVLTGSVVAAMLDVGSSTAEQ